MSFRRVPRATYNQGMAGLSVSALANLLVSATSVEHGDDTEGIELSIPAVNLAFTSRSK